MRALAVVLVALALGCAAGCGADDAARSEGPTPVIAPGRVGELRLGATATGLLARGLISDLRPGCELDVGQRVADLSPPLRGLAIFSHPNTRLSSIALDGGAETAAGIGIGARPRAVLDVYPGAEFLRPDPEAPITIGSIMVDRAGELALTFGVDALTGRVTHIGVPWLAICE